MKKLVQLKLDVINTHEGDQNTYLRSSMAGDACYSSNNSIQYKTQQMSDVRAELASLRPAEGSEVIDVKLAKKVDIYNRMSDELLELQERFNADKAVYKAIADEEWKPWKKTTQKAVSSVLNELDKIFGKDEAPVQEAK